MNAIEMIKEKVRLTRGCTIYCTTCRLSPQHNGRDCNCTDFQNKYPEEYVDIILRWSKDFPKETYINKLLKEFPNAINNSRGYPPFCPADLEKSKAISLCDSEFGNDDEICLRCWNQECK